MKEEQKYAFRKRIDCVHESGRYDHSLQPSENETVIDAGWKIAFTPETENAALDLQDYFLKSMGLTLALTMDANCGNAICLQVGGNGRTRGFRFTVTDSRVELQGNDYAGVMTGAVYLEDLLNLRKEPYLMRQNVCREPLFSPRMVHSGWGLDQFPDSHLNAILHAGFDSILLFVEGVNRTTHGYMDFNDLIARAGKYALNVYFYSYLPSFKHPDEPDAEEFFEKNFGAVFRNAPGAKGLILVGESAQFPSRDPECTGRDRLSENTEKIADHRESPGFWPCKDYPQWLNAVKKAVRRYSPEAEIIFWTYNWGKAPADKRLALIHSLPKDITLEATFEMYERHEYPNHTMVQPDYSITFPGPGFYFSSEAECAKECGLPLYTMSNTAGRTWDFGGVPYMPFPQQWLKRMDALRKAHREWGLSGLMDSHHYGWYPSIISDCAKWCFLLPDEPAGRILRRLLVRDYGEKGAVSAEQGFQILSDVMDSYTPGFDDQAGPLRCGPAYPFILNPILYPHAEQGMKFPTYPESAVGGRWIHTYYQPECIYGHSWCGLRIHEDIRIMGGLIPRWKEGVRLLRLAAAEADCAADRENALRTAGVAEFCFRSFLTMYLTKRWWLLNKQLEAAFVPENALAILDEMEAVIAEERKNVCRTLPLVKMDSSLGWEPSMDYIADAGHLEWKLRQLENLQTRTLPGYRKTLSARPVSPDRMRNLNPADLQIIVSPETGETGAFAAAELQRVLFRMTGKQIPVDAADKPFRIELSIDSESAALRFDGFAFGIGADHIRITAKCPRGILNGVYNLLEQWGCRQDCGAELRIPERGSLFMPEPRIWNPDFEIRGICRMSADCTESGWLDWMAFNRFNLLMLSADEDDFRRTESALRPELQKRGMKLVRADGTEPPGLPEQICRIGIDADSAVQELAAAVREANGNGASGCIGEISCPPVPQLHQLGRFCWNVLETIC